MIEKLQKGRVRLRTRCLNQHGEVVVDGEAMAIAASHIEDVI